jgi:hypothetical protein
LEKMYPPLSVSGVEMSNRYEAPAENSSRRISSTKDWKWNKSAPPLSTIRADSSAVDPQ